MKATDFSVTFVSSAAEIDPALWESCFSPEIEGRWWYDTLERSGLGDQFTFLYGVIQRGGGAVGIAPAFLMDFPLSLVAPDGLLPALRWLSRIAPTLGRPRTLFVGSPCSDQGTVGMLDGVDRQAALLALQSALLAWARAARAALLVWKDFPEPDTADLEWLAQREGLFSVVSFPGTVVDFTTQNKDDYLASLTRKHRYNVRRNLRISFANVALRTEIVRVPGPRVLDELFGLFRQTYEKATTRFEELNPEFFAVVATQPPAYFIVLREEASGAMVAFMLCFDLGKKIINKFVGFDYRRPREWLLYFRLWDAAVDWALSRGATSIQSGQTGYAPKLEIGHRLVPLYNYCVHRNPVLHALLAAVAKRVDWSTLDDDLARHASVQPDVRRDDL